MRDTQMKRLRESKSESLQTSLLVANVRISYTQHIWKLKSFKVLGQSTLWRTFEIVRLQHLQIPSSKRIFEKHLPVAQNAPPSIFG